MHCTFCDFNFVSSKNICKQENTTEWVEIDADFFVGT